MKITVSELKKLIREQVEEARKKEARQIVYEPHPMVEIYQTADEAHATLERLRDALKRRYINMSGDGHEYAGMPRRAMEEVNKIIDALDSIEFIGRHKAVATDFNNEPVYAQIKRKQ